MACVNSRFVRVRDILIEYSDCLIEEPTSSKYNNFGNMIYTALLIVTHSYVVENKKLEGSCLGLTIHHI
jgi:hypothetical protein